MNKEDPYRDQAEKLRQKIERPTFEEGKPVKREELPPRSAVHRHGKSKKTKLKVKYPLIRLLALFFVLLPITVISIYSIIAKDKIDNVKETIIESTEEFETIEIEEEENQIMEDEEGTQEEAENSNPDNEQAGESLTEPQSRAGAGHKTAAAPLTVYEKDIIYHKVKRGETITRISLKYYRSKAGIEIIKAANDLTSNEILAGQVLTIPLNK